MQKYDRVVRVVYVFLYYHNGYVLTSRDKWNIKKEVDLSSDGTKLYKAGTKIISQTIKRNVKYHNLDAAISVDYRVNSYRVFNLDEGQ